MRAGAPRTLPLRGLLGAPLDRLPTSAEEPVADRTLGAERWLVYEREDLTLRVRCDAEPPHAVAFWMVRFARGCETLRAAADRLGLWPACGPDVIARDVSEPLIRRPLPAAGGQDLHSLTATVRAGRITAISAFDEPPDWL